MKKVILSLVIILSFALTGCASVQENKKSDTDAVAEYIASLLLKYDRYYDNKLVNLDDIVTEQDAIEDVSDGTTDDNDSILDENDSTDGSIVTDTSEEPVEEPELTLSEAIGNDNFSINYVTHKMYKEYPEVNSGSYFTLTAGENRELMVVLFKLTNQTDETKKISLIDAGITYRLTMNDALYKPLFTLLVNDLQFIDVTIKPNASSKGYLVFEVPENTKIESAILEVTNGDKTANVAIE